MAELNSVDITEDEAALYDRQIRLWGLDAQKRLRLSNILLVGMNGLGAEVAKNLVLAGIKSLTILDQNEVTIHDSKTQFLFSNKDVGKKRAEVASFQVQLLNPMVEVVADIRNQKNIDSEYLSKYNIVCVMGSNIASLVHINNLCRKTNTKFFCGDVWGIHGYFFLDLNHHSYVEEVPYFSTKSDDEDGDPKPKRFCKGKKVTQVMTKSADFIPLEKALAVKAGKSGTGLDKRTSPLFLLLHVLFRFRTQNERHPLQKEYVNDLNKFVRLKNEVMDELGIDKKRLDDKIFRQTFGELSPVCAVVGGVLAQEIIKAISCKGTPIRNFFLFDGNEGCGIVENIGR